MDLTWWVQYREPNTWDVVSHVVYACDYENRFGHWHYIDISDIWAYKLIEYDWDSSFYHRVLGDRSYCYMKEKRI